MNNLQGRVITATPNKGLRWVWIVTALLVALGGCSGNGRPVEGDAVAGPVVLPPSAPATGDSGPPSTGDSGPLSVRLNATQPTVKAGETVRLTWSSGNADACEASGGWSGSRPANGTMVVGPLTESTTFTLTCSGAGDNAMAMLSIGIAGVITLKWQPPAENVDGTPLTDLSGYRIYYGEQSREYSNRETVSNPRAISHDVSVVSGSYYFAMTALDGEGNESGYSNEVVKSLN